MLHWFKDIGVFFDSSDTGLRVLDIAAYLASTQQALLTAMTTAIPDENSSAAESFARGAAIREVISRRSSSTAASLLKAGRWLAKTTARHGTEDVEFRVIAPTESASEALLYARYCDLLVASHPEHFGRTLFLVTQSSAAAYGRASADPAR